MEKTLIFEKLNHKKSFFLLLICCSTFGSKKHVFFFISADIRFKGMKTNPKNLPCDRATLCFL